MAVLDLKKGWDSYDELARKTENPRHKAILEVMKEHLKWEVLGYPDKVLETVADGGVYKFWGIAAHGTWHQAFPGDKVPVVKVDDPSAKYLVSSRLAWFFPFSEGPEPKLVSELVYFDPAPTAVRKLDPSEKLYDELSEDVFS